MKLPRQGGHGIEAGPVHGRHHQALHAPRHSTRQLICPVVAELRRIKVAVGIDEHGNS